jgi:hypothetical protein
MFYYLYVYGFAGMFIESVEMKETLNDLARIGFVPEKTANEGINENQEDEELDLLPEFCHYQDEGCELAPACLECPFPDCMYQRYRGNLAQVKHLRDKEIVRLHKVEKIDGPELSTRFHISLRTVRRVLASEKMKNE